MLNPESQLSIAKVVVAKLLIHDQFVTARRMMEMGDGRLTMQQSRRMLRQLVRIEWMTQSDVHSLGYGFNPTPKGRDGLAALLDVLPQRRTATIPTGARPARSKKKTINRRASSISDLRKGR